MRRDSSEGKVVGWECILRSFQSLSTSVAIMLLSSEQWAFSMEMYFSHGHSIVAVEHAFCLNYGIPPRAAVPDQKSVVSRVAAFRTTGRD